MTLLSEARALLLQAADADGLALSEAQRSAMRRIAWQLSPCTCGASPESRGHSVYCLNGESDPGTSFHNDRLAKV